MSAADLLSRTVLFQGADAAFWAFCERMGVAPELAFLDRDPEGYAFMAERRNHLDGGVLSGDFRLGFDLYLWDRDEGAFLRDLKALSSDGMALATETDADRASPFAFTPFLEGEAVAVEIMDDEVAGETLVQSPSWVRPHIKALWPAV